MFRKINYLTTKAMGLDAVELILDVEETFGISVSNGQASGIRTPGDLILLIQNSVQSDKKVRPCITRQSFHHIRSALIKATGCRRKTIRLNTRIKSLFPLPGRNHRWLTLQRQLAPLRLAHPNDSIFPWFPGTVSDLVKQDVRHKSAILKKNEDWSHDEVRQITRLLISEFTGHHRFSDHDKFVRDLGMD